jgi:hypothetical protein
VEGEGREACLRTDWGCRFRGGVRSRKGGLVAIAYAKSCGDLIISSRERLALQTGAGLLLQYIEMRNRRDVAKQVSYVRRSVGGILKGWRLVGREGSSSSMRVSSLPRNSLYTFINRLSNRNAWYCEWDPVCRLLYIATYNLLLTYMCGSHSPPLLLHGWGCRGAWSIDTSGDGCRCRLE